MQLAAFRVAWLPYLYSIALFLKVLFAFAIISFWVMIGEISRATGERATVVIPPLRADLHDVCGKLDAISKFVQVACAHLEAGRMSDVMATLLKIRNQADLQNEFLRDVLGRLRSEDGALRSGLVPAITKLIDQLRSENPAIRFGFDIAQGQSSLTAPLEDCFYVVGRESLRNAVRHAQDLRSVSVALDAAAGCLIVEDDGQGAGPPAVAPPGRGIEIMRQCAARVGASMVFEVRPPHGTRMKLEVTDGK